MELNLRRIKLQGTKARFWQKYMDILDPDPRSAPHWIHESAIFFCEDPDPATRVEKKDFLTCCQASVCGHNTEE